jgi:hypothetical protein
MATELTATNVQDIFARCLYQEGDLCGLEKGEIPADCVRGEGIVMKAGFHPGRVEEAKPAIKELLAQLPEQFHKATGGGWSFLQMCVDKEGNQWGEHRNMDELLCLGIAAGMAAYCMPRDMWEMLPGGMPYVVLDTGS